MTTLSARKSFSRLIVPCPSPAWPRYFLLCHTIELALKGYLILRGVVHSKLRRKPYAHDLKRLLEEASRLDLRPSALTTKELGLLREAHVEFLPRYPTIEAKPVFIIDQFERAVIKLLCAVGISMRGKNYRLHVDC
jgi:hypothetical protein